MKMNCCIFAIENNRKMIPVIKQKMAYFFKKIVLMSKKKERS